MATFFQNLQMSPIPQTTFFAASYSKSALELTTLGTYIVEEEDMVTLVWASFFSYSYSSRQHTNTTAKTIEAAALRFARTAEVSLCVIHYLESKVVRFLKWLSFYFDS